MSAAPPLRIGVVGLGRAFTLMLPTFRGDPCVELFAACDPREAARAQFARDFAQPVHADVEALVVDPAVEVVYIASPNALHADHIGLAAEHGRHGEARRRLAGRDPPEAEARLKAARIYGGEQHRGAAPAPAVPLAHSTSGR